jgi:predicted signal transduction protein with EAL and GGDEF domain
VGDKILKEVAARLLHTLRTEDIVIRLGGDEFLIFLQDIRHPYDAAEVASHIIGKINEPYHAGDLTLSVSTSVGISIFPSDGQDIDTLISHADAAMYQAKQAGRNNFQFYSPEFASGPRLQMVIEQQLRSALHTDAFHLCYQPVVDLKTRDIVSVEALLRWRNSDVGPDQFVPIAEASGVINPIGRWVLQEASRQHNTWLASGLPAIPIAVNVSVVEFRDRNFVSRFQRIVHDHGIDVHALQLELTETAVMDDIEHAIALLSELKALGVKILLDDFGTGHSSLAYLARLPLNKMKIDKSFISRLESDVASRAVTDAVLALGHTLNLDMIAEGVESAGVLDYLQSRGCQQAQGYFFSKPMEGSAFESWYRENRLKS